jgi:hypothetical protein
MSLLLEQEKKVDRVGPAHEMLPPEYLGVVAALEGGPKPWGEISRYLVVLDCDLRSRTKTQLLDLLVDIGLVVAQEDGTYRLSIVGRLQHLIQDYLSRSKNIRVVEFVDRLLELTSELGHLNCTLGEGQTLIFATAGRPLYRAVMTRAKTILRVMCARLSVICSERTGQEASPYGDEAEFEFEPVPQKRFQVTVWFKNTPAHQEFDIQAQPVPCGS